MNYRNTAEILAAAYGMIQELDAPGMTAGEAEDEYVAPDRALRHGPPPDVRRFSSLAASRRHAMEWIRARLARGIALEEILVLVPHREDLFPLEMWLNDGGVQARIMGGMAQTGTVRLSTIHSAKGLDAACVLVLQAQQLPAWDDVQARRLLYLAMTRARNELRVSYCESSELLAQLKDVIGRIGSLPQGLRGQVPWPKPNPFAKL